MRKSLNNKKKEERNGMVMIATKFLCCIMCKVHTFLYVYCSDYVLLVLLVSSIYKRTQNNVLIELPITVTFNSNFNGKIINF